jgi:hypothetical protein
MDAMVPSYRVRREASALPVRMLMFAAAVMAAGAAGAGGWWAFQKFGHRFSGGVPLVEADPRPFKVRPDDPGGLRVPNQGELIMERPGNRTQSAAQAGRPAAVAPEAEAPNLGGLRAAIAPPPTPAPQPAVPAPVAATPAAAPAADTPRVWTGGRVQVQLGALISEEAARTEWDRLARRAPELFQGRTPQVLRLDRGEGQMPLFRLRASGLPDQETATEFCQRIRAVGGACVPVRG